MLTIGRNGLNNIPKTTISIVNQREKSKVCPIACIGSYSPSVTREKGLGESRGCLLVTKYYWSHR